MDIRNSLLMANMLGGKKLNATIVGSPTISSDFIVSGFSSSNYLIMPSLFRPQNNSWEICFKLKTPITFVNSRNKFFGNYNRSSSYDDYACIGLDIEKKNENIILTPVISFDGSSWGAIPRSYDVYFNTDTIYWIKLSFDGTKYLSQYSLDGINFIDIAYISSTSVLYQNKNYLQSIGYDYYSDVLSGGTYFPGSIYMAESYIKINNQIWWKGVK